MINLLSAKQILGHYSNDDLTENKTASLFKAALYYQFSFNKSAVSHSMKCIKCC